MIPNRFSNSEKTLPTPPGLALTSYAQLMLPLAIMAFMLNHSLRAVGFNLSISDLFLVIVVFLLAINSSLFIPRFSLVFFLILVAVTLSTTLLFVPIHFGVQTTLSAVISDLIKLCVSFLYFIVGASVTKLNLHGIVLKWFSFGAFGVAIIGLAASISGISLLNDVIFYGGLRFRGFMSDPNFYATLSCASIAYFTFTSNMNRYLKWLAIITLAFSVLLSGSKTGLITLALLILIIFATKAIKSWNFGPVGILLVLFAVVYPFLGSIRVFLAQLSIKYSQQFPQLDRVSVLLSDDPLSALSGDGSTREDSWSHGLSIIKESPVFGIGIGTYSDVNEAINSSRILAHNTYIQIAAEWGIVLMVVLFAWIVALVLQSLRPMRDSLDLEHLDSVRTVIIVFLIGSLTLSLNNARMFWVFLGILSYLVLSNSSSSKSIGKKVYI